MKHSLASENLDIETSPIPHTHREDEQEEHVAPKRAAIEHVHRGKFRQDSVHKLPSHERGFPVLRWECRQKSPNDTSFRIQEPVEGSRPLSGLNFLPSVNKDKLPVQHLPDKV